LTERFAQSRAAAPEIPRGGFFIALARDEGHT
jgi:hypothetical protein